MATTHPTSVYRYYDAQAILIYVGITRRGTQRNTEHFRHKDWWQYVAEQRVEHYPDERSAHQREIELIRLHTPPFNTQHNPAWQEIRPWYLALRSAPVNDDHMGLWRAHAHALPARVRHQDATSASLVTRIEDMALATRVCWAGEVPVRQYRDNGAFATYGVAHNLAIVGPFLQFSVESNRGIPLIDHARLKTKPLAEKGPTRRYSLRYISLFSPLVDAR